MIKTSAIRGRICRGKPILIIMVKEPRPGRVKTRLGRDIGMQQAAHWFRKQSLSLIRRLSKDQRWQVVLAVSPDSEGLESPVWPKGLPRIGQGTGDLGQRMARLFRSMPPGPVVLIGADIPAVTAGHIHRAFRALGNRDVVFGPATDGGYWLVGLKRTRAQPSNLFQNVRWSTPFALADSRAGILHLRISETDQLHDVDTARDLGR